eukprot:scaffold135600_cov133-Phaeocystis_antarctica.AAC.3
MPVNSAMPRSAAGARPALFAPVVPRYTDMVRIARLVRAPRTYSAWRLGASCPTPLVHTAHRRLVRVAQYGGPGTHVLAQARTDPIRRDLQRVLAAGDQPRNQDGQRHAQIVEFEVQEPRRNHHKGRATEEQHRDHAPPEPPCIERAKGASAGGA